jgi:hypothetical protein
MLEPPNSQEIREQLWDQLNKAQAACLIATDADQFNLVIKECPSGHPHPDGALSIQQAGRDSRLALQHYMEALWRYTEFTLNGTIPDDLLPRADRHSRE